MIRLRGGEVPAGWADLQHWIDREGTPPQVDVGDHDLVRLMYTSGTESRPKGAMLSSRSLMWRGGCRSRGATTSESDYSM